ncbi:MAG TPA: hypothetical protein VN795_07400 [Stellaceae bacterium]|nr:hypothetical protein [Stellaceae bacterium]
MRFYPKLIGGYALFTVLGLIAGMAVGAFFLLATLPMVSLFPEPSMAPQVVLIVACFIGIITTLIVAALCIGGWQKRLQADYYREHAGISHAGPAWTLDRHVNAPPRRAARNR